MPTPFAIEAVGRYASTQARLKKNARRSATLELRPSLTVGTQTRKAKTGSRTQTRTKSTQTKTINGTTQEYAVVKSKIGSPERHTLNQAWKNILANTENVIFRISAANVFQGGESAVRIDTLQAGGPGTPLTLPVHLYDITSCVNNSAGDTLNAYAPGYYMVAGSEAATATSYWASLPAVFSPGNNGGTTVNTWAVEQSTFSAAKLNNLPGGNSFLKWMKLKMLCTSPSAKASRWEISLVQFKDAVLAPDVEGATLGTDEQQRKNAFNQGLAQRFAYNPIAIQSGGVVARNLKVLKKIEFISEPKLTNEPTTSTVAGHTKEVDLTYLVNKEMQYNWDMDVGQTIVTKDDFGLNQAINRNIVAPTKRIYLMIRCLATVGTAHSAAIHGSYDIVLRTCHRLSN